MNKLKQQIKKFITEEFDGNVPAIIDEAEAMNIINDLEREKIISFFILQQSGDINYWLEARTGVNIDNRYYGITLDYNVKLNDTLENLIENITDLEFHAKEVKRKFGIEKDPNWKSFEVKAICREDLQEYLTKKEILKVDDAKMKFIADKLGDALQDVYWISLEVIINDWIKSDLKN